MHIFMFPLLRPLMLFENCLPMIDIPIQSLTLWPLSSTMGVLKMHADCPVACDGQRYKVISRNRPSRDTFVQITQKLLNTKAGHN